MTHKQQVLIHYQNKMAAKADRGTFDAPGVVMRGPDHWRGESFNKSHQMRGKRSG